MVGVETADLGRDQRAGVIAGGAVALVAEATHQLDPRRGDPVVAPAALARRAREAVAGDRRDDEVERVGRVAAVRPRVGERSGDVEELEDRAGPAVGHDQRQGVRLGGAEVEEVDVLAVDLGRELRMGVDPGLGRPPVVLAPPVVVERSDVRLLDAVVYIAGELVGPAGAVEPIAQVVEVGLGDVELERSDRGVDGVGHRSALSLGSVDRNGMKCSVPLWRIVAMLSRWNLTSR